MEKFKLLLVLSISLLVLTLLPGPAKAETSCVVQGCDIKITIKLSFYDFRSQIGEQKMKDLAKKWEQEIESTWNGPNGHQTTGDCKCKVTFDAVTDVVSSCPTPPKDTHCIFVSKWDGTTGSLPYYMNATGHQVFVRAFMGFTTQSPSSGPAIDGWWSDVASQNAKDAAHEAGHLMGLDDKEGNGIMTNTQGPNAKPTQQNIDDAVKNVCGPNACPDRCCCGNGKVDKNKGEQCDPKATPVGCTADQSCCPTCCKCYTGNHTHPEANETQARVEVPPEFEKIKDSAVTFLDQALETQPLLQNLFGNERINVYIEGMDTPFHIITSQGRVQTAEMGELPDQTLNFYTDTETIDLLSAGEMGIMNALEEGRMKYEGVGVVNAIKIGLANTLFGIFSFFEDVPNQIIRMLG